MKRTLIPALVAAAFAVPAWAETQAGSPDFESETALLHRHLAAATDDIHKSVEDIREWAHDFSHDMAMLYSGRIGSSKVVKGAPYSAEIVTENNQALADGNVITHKSSAMVYRDAQGRTRQETGADGVMKTVHISDPVEGRGIILTPASKRAIIMPRSFAVSHEGSARERRVVNMGGTEIRIDDGKVTVDGKEVAGKIELKSGSGKNVKIEDGRITIDGKELSISVPNVVVKTVRDEGGDGTHEEVRVKVVRTGDISDIGPAMAKVMENMPNVAALPGLPGMHGMHFESTAALGKAVTTKLGTRDFGGVSAEGTSKVWTIPAGQIGNRNPIQVTSESWYSPELQVTVYSRYNDPRAGESIYRLANLRRAEPSADLFKVPEGYNVRDRSKRGENK